MKFFSQSRHDCGIDYIYIYISSCASFSLTISSVERQEAIDLSKTGATCKVFKDHFPLLIFKIQSSIA